MEQPKSAVAPPTPAVEIVPTKYRGQREYLLVYMELINAARYQGVVTYQDIARLMGLPQQGSYMGSEVGWIIGEISEDEVKHGRPMLSALTVGTSGKPGQGFFALARQFGYDVSDSKADQLAFWESQRDAAYAEWRKPIERRKKA